MEGVNHELTLQGGCQDEQAALSATNPCISHILTSTIPYFLPSFGPVFINMNAKERPSYSPGRAFASGFAAATGGGVKEAQLSTIVANCERQEAWPIVWNI